MPHLPMSRQEMSQYGWETLDFLFISGDAYVDHPSFGCAIISRVLADAGYRVGIIAQPDVQDPRSLLQLGKPELAVLISSGVVDSMVNHYTAALRRRSTDAYSAGGKAGQRPDRAIITYSHMVRRQLGSVPLIIGGIEASLRRLAHYDYWSDTVRPGILEESQADLLVYGEGERSLLDAATYLARGVPHERLNALPGTAVLLRKEQLPRRTIAFLDQFSEPVNLTGKSPSELAGDCLPQDDQHVLLPSAEQVRLDLRACAVAARVQLEEQDPGQGRRLIQPHGDRFLIQNPPARPLDSDALDRVYSLPYTREAHPVYKTLGGVPALQEVRFSITAHRGCYGGCHFCAITQHMGRLIRARSDASILSEVDQLAKQPDFKGYIHDIGGPTANFHQPACARQRSGSVCRRRQCLFPEPCTQLEIDHKPYRDLLEKARKMPGVRRVFIRSGIRFDTLMADRDPSFFEQLCSHHVSGQLKVAPEHISDNVLYAMGKPGGAAFQSFSQRFTAMNEQLGLRQYLVPYLMSGHPGSTLEDAVMLAQYLKKTGRRPEQVQDFYPTPGTLSTVMYHTGLNPLTMQPIHVPDQQEKRLQRALLQPFLSGNRRSVLEALRLAGREDLIGSGPECLISEGMQRQKRRGHKTSSVVAKNPYPVKATARLEDHKDQRHIDEGGKQNEHNHARKRTGGKAACQDRGHR